MANIKDEYKEIINRMVNDIDNLESLRKIHTITRIIFLKEKEIRMVKTK